MEIKTDDLFDSEFDKCVDYALLEFGRKTAQKWIDGLIGIKHHLCLNCRNGESIVVLSS